MLLNRRERAMVDGGIGAGDDTTFPTPANDSVRGPYRSLGLSAVDAMSNTYVPRSGGIFHAIAGKDDRVSKEALLGYLARIVRGKRRKRTIGAEWWRPIYEAFGGTVWRETGTDAAVEVVNLLFAAADDELDGELRGPELLKFMQLYKHFFECYAATEMSFRKAVLEPLEAAIADDQQLTRAEVRCL